MAKKGIIQEFKKFYSKLGADMGVVGVFDSPTISLSRFYKRNRTSTLRERLIAFEAPLEEAIKLGQETISFEIGRFAWRLKYFIRKRLNGNKAVHSYKFHKGNVDVFLK